MIETLFNNITHAIEGSGVTAVLACLVWGVLSVILSPCHLASIPLIVGFISTQKVTTTRRAFFISMFYSFGIFVTIGIIGVITALAGQLLGNIGGYGNFIVAAIFFLTGFHLLGVINLPFQALSKTNVKTKGILAGFILGLLFGVAIGPCSFAYMAPILGVTFKLSSSQFLYGILLIIMYGVGHCSVIILAGTSTEIVQNYLNWNQSSKLPSVFKIICGLVLLAFGVYLVYEAV